MSFKEAQQMLSGCNRRESRVNDIFHVFPCQIDHFLKNWWNLTVLERKDIRKIVAKPQTSLQKREETKNKDREKDPNPNETQC